MARSPWSASPSIRFLFVGPRLSLPPSSRRSLAVPPLGFATIPVARFREDFHLQVQRPAGRTKRKGPSPVRRRPFYDCLSVSLAAASATTTQAGHTSDQAQDDQ